MADAEKKSLSRPKQHSLQGGLAGFGLHCFPDIQVDNRQMFGVVYRRRKFLNGLSMIILDQTAPILPHGLMGTDPVILGKVQYLPLN